MWVVSDPRQFCRNCRIWSSNDLFYLNSTMLVTLDWIFYTYRFCLLFMYGIHVSFPLNIIKKYLISQPSTLCVQQFSQRSTLVCSCGHFQNLMSSIIMYSYWSFQKHHTFYLLIITFVSSSRSLFRFPHPKWFLHHFCLLTWCSWVVFWCVCVCGCV